jgi:predicted  nucleic acid-binding Zn-ribbon protein
MNAKKRGRPKKTKHIEELVNPEPCQVEIHTPIWRLNPDSLETVKEIQQLKEGIANLEKVNAYLADRIKDLEKSTVESAMKYSYWERDATAKQELIDSYLDQVDTLKSDARALESARSYWMGEAQKREEEIASLTKCLESITDTVKQKDIDFEATLSKVRTELMDKEDEIDRLICENWNIRNEGIWEGFMRKLFGGKNGS